MLAGFADNYSIGAQSGLFGTRNYEVGAFAQDDWKLSRRLTLNLGFRWDLITYPTEEHNREAALNPNSSGTNPDGVPRGAERRRPLHHQHAVHQLRASLRVLL